MANTINTHTLLVSFRVVSSFLDYHKIDDLNINNIICGLKKERKKIKASALLLKYIVFYSV